MFIFGVVRDVFSLVLVRLGSLQVKKGWIALLISSVLETQDESLPRCLEPAVQVQSRLRLAAKSRSLGLIAAGRPLSQ